MYSKYLAIGTKDVGSINPPSTVPQGGIDKLVPIVTNGISLMLFAISVLSLIFLIVGGIQWISSGGDKAKVQGARNRITYAIIGLIVAFLAFAIINLVGYFFKIDSLLNIQKL